MQLKYKIFTGNLEDYSLFTKFSPTYIMFDIHKELKLKIRDEFLLISFKYNY